MIRNINWVFILLDTLYATYREGNLMEPWWFIDLPNLVYIYMSSKSEHIECMGTLLLHLYNNFFVNITFYKLENSSDRFHCSYYTIKTISETTAKTAMLPLYFLTVLRFTFVNIPMGQFKRNLLIHIIDG